MSFIINKDSEYVFFGNYMIPAIIYNYYKDNVPIDKLIEVYGVQRYTV